jgi:hypothetical protein
MCTVTVQQTPGRYRVTMNRDELRTRGPERPPSLHSNGGVTWAGPVDSDAGGTWFGTNEFGITACLLNAYFPLPASPEVNQQGAQSRGVIIPQALRHRTLAACEQWMREQLNCASFAGFMLLLTSPDGCIHYLWPGHGEMKRVPHDDEWTFLTSSFIDSTHTEEYRAATFRSFLDRGAPDRDGLPEFHVERAPGKESLATLMDRGYSVTRSITQATCAKGETRMRYWADPQPDLDAADPTSALSLAHSKAPRLPAGS